MCLYKLSYPISYELVLTSFNALLRTPYIFKGNIKIAGPGLYPGAWSEQGSCSQ